MLSFMSKSIIAILFVVLSIGCINETAAQPLTQFIKVIVAPDHTDWTYKPGEKVKFTITVMQNGNVLKNAVVKYEIGPEKMEPVKTDSLKIVSGTITVEGGTLKS